MNACYDLAREMFLTGSLSWLGGEIEAWLVTDAYAFDPAHTSLTQVSTSERVKARHSLTDRTADRGIAGSGPVTFGVVFDKPRPFAALLLVHSPSGILVWFGDEGFGIPAYPGATEVVAHPEATLGGWFQL